jgi:hypothetical protein
LHFSLAQALRHFRLGQIIASCRSAADLRFRNRYQFEFRNHLQQLPRLPADLLRVTEMAGILVDSA